MSTGKKTLLGPSSHSLLLPPEIYAPGLFEVLGLLKPGQVETCYHSDMKDSVLPRRLFWPQSIHGVVYLWSQSAVEIALENMFRPRGHGGCICATTSKTNEQ